MRAQYSVHWPWLPSADMEAGVGWGMKVPSLGVVCGQCWDNHLIPVPSLLPPGARCPGSHSLTWDSEWKLFQQWAVNITGCCSPRPHGAPNLERKNIFCWRGKTSKKVQAKILSKKGLPWLQWAMRDSCSVRPDLIFSPTLQVTLFLTALTCLSQVWLLASSTPRWPNSPGKNVKFPFTSSGFSTTFRIA